MPHPRWLGGRQLCGATEAKTEVASGQRSYDASNMIVLAFALQAASAPPVPPPPRESYLAAIALWQDHAPSVAERRSAIDRVVGMAASGALAQVGIQVTYPNEARSDAGLRSTTK